MDSTHKWRFSVIIPIVILILGVGVAGGLYWLNQTRIALVENQLFNEQFNQAVAFLKDEDITVRSAGIRSLSNLGANAEAEQADLVVRVIYDFVRNRAEPEFEINGDGTVKENLDGQPILTWAVLKEDRTDLELAVFAVADIAQKAGAKTNSISLAGLDLRYLNFRELHLPHASFFKGAYLSGANFEHANLQGIDFNGAKLQNVHFDDTNLQEANFDYAHLDGVSFRRVNLQEISFRKANLQETLFKHVSGKGVDFSESNFWLVSFLEANLNAANFSEAKLPLADFDNANVQEANFSKSRLHLADFDKANVQGANFDEAALHGTGYTDANFNDAKGLTQEQIDLIVFEDGKPPTNLPLDAETGEPLELPLTRAYIYEPTVYGIQCKHFIKSDQPWSEKPCREWLFDEIAEAQNNTLDTTPNPDLR